jgi:hypothetical protein
VNVGKMMSEDFKKPRHRIEIKDSVVKEEDRFIWGVQ